MEDIGEKATKSKKDQSNGTNRFEGTDHGRGGGIAAMVLPDMQMIPGARTM